ncbi:MAG: DUF559 domain-containing protein [Planctomycetaceae bacterium]|nr:DUF559 domain-containing protein [Planctomycetaceae bacterium]
MLELKLLERLGFYKPVDHAHQRFERLSRWCESPVESAFWSVGYWELSKHGRLTPQVKVGRYRLDFALEAQTFKLAIEIDGHDYHSSKEQRAADYQRDRSLQMRGWRVVRFSGSEVVRDAAHCVLEVIRVVRGVR